MLKPKPDNTDRPGERAPGIRQWKDPRHSDVIRCAVAEAAGECGMDAALTMVDLEKFYDTVPIDHLVNMALSLQALARVLLIDLMAFMAPRATHYLGAVSEWLNPGVSIARILLCDVLERVQAHVPVGGRHQLARDRDAKAR